MIDWLLPELHDPQVEIAGRRLPLAIRRHPRARRLTLRLAGDGSVVQVTMPPWGQTREALAFARARSDWLAGQLARLPRVEAVAPGVRIAFRGRPVEVLWRKDAPRRPGLANGQLVLGGAREAVPDRLRRWLENQALGLLAADLAFYCHRAGQPLPRLALSRARRRWGSCALGPQRQGAVVRINWRLVMAPDPVRRSVVAHEVAHLSHFDHSPAFHAHLATLFEGDLHAANAWLREHGALLYRHFS